MGRPFSTGLCPFYPHRPSCASRSSSSVGLKGPRGAGAARDSLLSLYETAKILEKEMRGASDRHSISSNLPSIECLE
eukprot:scaffold212614_cov16-Tisochrysis_lutea.AAC.1